MMRSLYSGVAGLKNHQTQMDVVGNNVANVNTTGFKASRVTFQDMLSQTTKGASSPTGTGGGTNPLQVGLGMSVASIDTIFSPGSRQTTGKNTDLSIGGVGFFMIQNGMNTYYTRAGNFDFDEMGNYVIPGTGMQVMGWVADANGNIETNGAPTGLTIPLNRAMSPKATATIAYSGGNLAQDATVGTIYKTNITVFDSMGTKHEATVNYTKVNDYTWSVEFDVEDTKGGPYTGTVVFDPKGKYLYDTFTSGVVSGLPTTVAGSTAASANPTSNPTSIDVTSTVAANGVMTVTTVEVNNVVALYQNAGNALDYTYNAAAQSYTNGANTYQLASDGTWRIGGLIGGAQLPGTTPGAEPILHHYTYNTVTTVATVTPGAGTTCAFAPDNGAAELTITPDLTKLTQYGGTGSTAKLDNQDGYTSGTLDRSTLGVDANGIIYGEFSNGQIMSLGQVALANFTNSAGLTKVGNSLYSESNNSGVARIGIAGQDGYGGINPSTLEMSNVDLSEEFTQLIVTQRGFQANSRIITTSDTLLEELINLKR